MSTAAVAYFMIHVKQFHASQLIL